MHSTLFLIATLVAATPTDFDTDILPVLTRRGCNSGACHGAAAGRGGFKLSLFAGDPAADHRAIARELEGKRVNLARPDRSLLLAKPIGYLDHEGGALLDEGSEDAELIQRWIAEGAERLQLRQLTELQVTPSEVYLAETAASTSLRVTARFSDGLTRDVTPWTVFSPDDPAAVRVDSRGELQVLRRGLHNVAIRFLTELRSVQVTVPLRDEPSGTSVASGHWLDEQLARTFSALRLSPGADADDSTIVRRLYLDLAGRLPRVAEWQQYLNDPRTDKYERLVEQLLSAEAFADYWTFRVAHWLKIPAYAQRDGRGATAYHDWLRSQFTGHRGWNAIARDLLMAEGDSHLVGAANFHRQATDARTEAELVAESLLGIELRCANCHNHPLDRWTQDDYHGLAAVLVGVERGQVVSLDGRGEVTNPATGAAALPRLPGTQFLAEGSDPLPALAAWLTAKDNPYFAKAFVNRTWKELMGRGFVEPADALRATNPGSHPDVLQRLVDEFVDSDFQLRQLVRQIVLARAYRRQSGADDQYYCRAAIRPLSPEVFIDAVIDVTSGSSSPDRERAIQTCDAFAHVPAVAAVSGCTSDRNCLPSDSLGTDLATRLLLINGPLLNERIADPRGFLAERIASGQTNEAIVAELYGRALSRRPSAEEQAYWQTQFQGNDAVRAERLQDLLWSLLTCREFTTNH